MIKYSSYYFRWTIGTHRNHLSNNIISISTKSKSLCSKRFYKNTASSSQYFHTLSTSQLKSTTIQRVININRSTSTSTLNPLELYTQVEVDENVFHIEENYFDSWNKANIYFIKGNDADLLIDSGIGVFDLSTYLRASGLRNDTTATKSKPLHIAVTHTHFDHSGGLYHFDKTLSNCSNVYIHKNESRVMLHSNAILRAYKTASWITPEEILLKPYPEWNAKTYQVNLLSKVISIEENHEFDLGNFQFKVIHLPGHTNGSIGLVDQKRGILATGDTLYSTSGELIDWYVGGSSVNQMANSVRRLSNIIEAKKVELILPGHNNVMGRDIALSEAAKHLSALGKGFERTVAKGWSRTRTRSILFLNAIGAPLPDISRDWLTK